MNAKWTRFVGIVIRPMFSESALKLTYSLTVRYSVTPMALVLIAET
jgi:hypothetical protein